MTLDRSRAHNFDDEEVARAYRHRPPYSADLYDWMGRLPPCAGSLLDLGCGPGKLAGPLARYFEQVDAVDPAAAMLQVAAELFPGASIRWHCCPAEEFLPKGSFDLITIGAAIHWMDHLRLFPLLCSWLVDGGILAVIDGDEAQQPPWEEGWQALMVRWLSRSGQRWQPAAFRSDMRAWRRWVNVLEERTFSRAVTQTLDSFIECQHSRATWARAVMGIELATEFDAEIRELLTPHLDNGQLRYETTATAVACHPRRSRSATTRAS